MSFPYHGGSGLVAKSCLTLETPWTVVHQAPLSMGFPRQEYWSGLYFLPQGISSIQVLDLNLLHCRWILYRGCFSVAQCPNLCKRMDCSTPGLPVPNHLLEFAQVHVPWISGAFHLSCPLLLSSLFAFTLSQHQGLFQWVGSSYQVAKLLELQLQFQSFQWIFRVDFPCVLTVSFSS